MTHDIFTRALKTFIQAVLGFICTLSLTDIDLGDDTVRAGIILAAVAAGLSALMNIDWKAEEEKIDTAVSETLKDTPEDVIEEEESDNETC